MRGVRWEENGEETRGFDSRQLNTKEGPKLMIHSGLQKEKPRCDTSDPERDLVCRRN